MIKIIAGQTGEGKTKFMIDIANEQVRSLKGHAIYIDNCTNHRLALAHQIRLIEAVNAPIQSREAFMGYLHGILSANHDIEVIFIDGLVKITQCSLEELGDYLTDIQKLSEETGIHFVIGASCSKEELPEHLTPYFLLRS